MGANKEAITAVNESAFNDIEWEDQATGVAAANSAPSAATDGVSLDGRSAVAYQVYKESGTVDLEITLHGYANGNWGKIPDSTFTVDDQGLLDGTTVAGMLERIYIEVSTYTSGTVTLAVGVPKP